MIVLIRKERPGAYRVYVWSGQAYALGSYSNVKVLIDEKEPEEFDELYLEAARVKYIKEKEEVHVYTR